jgi:dTDP-4-amino-4,6-dideoxygalactose transaminase
MRDTLLPFAPPDITEDDVQEVISTLRSGWITTGDKAHELERRFTEYVGADAALALNSGTAALHTGLCSLGVGPGDLVFTTPLTFCSTVHVIEHLGARPVLVDVQRDTLNIDPDKLRTAVRDARRAYRDGTGDRPRALLPVDLYGHPCEWELIREIAIENDLVIVEDAAHALAAEYRDERIGSLKLSTPGPPMMTCFSFYATKNLTTAEGGMLVGPAELIEEARLWSLHGMSRDAWMRYAGEGSWQYDVTRPGFKYNMPDILASIGLHQLARLRARQRRRREIVEQYHSVLGALEELELPTERGDVSHAWHLYVVRLSRAARQTLSREQFIAELHKKNIGTSVHFIPVHLFAYYRDKYRWRPADFPIAYEEYQRMVSLPLYPRMTDRDVADVVDAVTSALSADLGS